MELTCYCVKVGGGRVDKVERNLRGRWKMVGEWERLLHCVNVMKTSRLSRRLFSIECYAGGYGNETVIHLIID
jgi:hypothetical protein